MTQTAANLKEIWREFQIENPKTRIYDAAKQLETSEMQLLATNCGESVFRLEGDAGEMLIDFGKLGRVMALTRNAQVVHERKGAYSKIEIMREHGNMGQVLDEGIDLRLFLNNWKHVFVVNDENRRSFQFFDKHGTAIHKTFLLDESDAATFDEIAAKYQSSNQVQIVDVEPKQAKKVEKPDSEIDIMTFRSRWAAMRDTHEFFRLISSFELTRTQALRLAGADFAYKIEPKTGLRKLLETVSTQKMPIMVFVGNDGVIQIHSGEINRVLQHGEWFNVMDKDFNLHVFEPEIASAWIVKKPTMEGIVTSLELFNNQGENVVLFFSKRKPGEAENQNWRDILEDFDKI